MTLYTREAFYESDRRRMASPEADYGVWWTNNLERWPYYRVSYVQFTGEVYAIESASGPTSWVLVLGVVPPDSVAVGDVYYRTLDRILEGWAYSPMHLNWVRDRLARASMVAPSGA